MSHVRCSSAVYSLPRLALALLALGDLRSAQHLGGRRARDGEDAGYQVIRATRRARQTEVQSRTLSDSPPFNSRSQRSESSESSSSTISNSVEASAWQVGSNVWLMGQLRLMWAGEHVRDTIAPHRSAECGLSTARLQCERESPRLLPRCPCPSISRRMSSPCCVPPSCTQVVPQRVQLGDPPILPISSLN